MTTYNDLTYAYGSDNVKQLGNKVIVIDRNYKLGIGYTVATYNAYTPLDLKDKIYTDLSNTGYDFDSVYDFLYGTPDGTILEAFKNTVRKV